MSGETWIQLDVSIRLRVEDEGALVQAGLAALAEDPDVPPEAREMRARQISDAEFGALAAVSWLLDPDRLVRDIPGIEPHISSIAGNIAESEEDLDEPRDLH